MDALNDFTWYSGLGLTWANNNVPYTYAGGKIFWCPAERVNMYDKVVSGNAIAGPGRYFHSATTPVG